jgi:iron complex outermembrane recepter protein
VNYKQALTFLPNWARGVQVFGNSSIQRATGDEGANFAGFLPKIFNWGVSLNREKFDLRVNWNYRARARGAAVNGRSIEPGTYNWTSKRLYIDVSGEYRFLRHYAVFFKMRNLDDATDDTKTFGPNTPAVANFRSRVDFGSLWTLGVNAKF